MKALTLLPAASIAQTRPAFTITINASRTVVVTKSPIESDNGESQPERVTNPDEQIVKSNPLKITVTE